MTTSQQHRIQALEQTLNAFYHSNSYPRNDLKVPPVKGKELKAGESGYITFVTTTKAGAQALKSPEWKLTECDIFILTFAQHQERLSLDVIIRETPYIKKKVIRYTQLLFERGFVKLDFEQRPFGK